MAETAVARRPPTNFEIELAEYEPQIAAVLPLHIPPERFRRVVITAVNLNPDLAKADRRSLFTACVRAAADGLYPDGREAALVMFDGKATYMPMVHGIRKRMRNTGEVLSADAQVVYAADQFDYQLGDEPRINHKPGLGDRGKPTGAYAIIKLSNGETIREYMSLAQIEKVRSVSRAANHPKGPWVNWWDEMARKTVLRRASKAAPTSPEIDMLLRRDDDMTDEEAPAPPPPRPTIAEFKAADRPMPAREVVQDEEEDAPPLSDVVLDTAEAMAQEERAGDPPALPQITLKMAPPSPAGGKATYDWDAFEHEMTQAIATLTSAQADQFGKSHAIELNKAFRFARPLWEKLDAALRARSA